MHTLYIVPTPIGNLEDVTVRALHTLRAVALIAAEDTRHTLKLLNHYHIRAPLISYHEHNKLTRLEAIFEALAKGDVALVSDAGTPGISDPGYELVREAVARGVPVEALPGPNAVITALSASGLIGEAFLFLGFPPRKAGRLRTFLAEVAHYEMTLVFYEAPTRLVETLAAATETLGDRRGVVALELTKLFEEIRRAPLSDLLAHYRAYPPRGEVTLLIEGRHERRIEGKQP